MFCSVLFGGELCGKYFFGLVVKLEVDKTEAAVVVDKDSGTFVALLGEFAFQLCEKIPLQLTSFGQPRCTLQVWLRQRPHGWPWFPCLTREAWSSRQTGSQHTWEAAPWQASLGSHH